MLEEQEKGHVKFDYIASEDNPAVLLTKALPVARHQRPRESGDEVHRDVLPAAIGPRGLSPRGSLVSGGLLAYIGSALKKYRELAVRGSLRYYGPVDVYASSPPCTVSSRCCLLGTSPLQSHSIWTSGSPGVQVQEEKRRSRAHSGVGSSSLTSPACNLTVSGLLDRLVYRFKKKRAFRKRIWVSVHWSLVTCWRIYWQCARVVQGACSTHFTELDVYASGSQCTVSSRCSQLAGYPFNNSCLPVCLM
ncbi:hypothetical protein FN846DRAFT_88575 [Sphaerosporella brunnea]|uniref:Uncharacterized protein n=1 Tax=Sphaerosporella brunnea TaxID=1250544 RepID=A0A5J5ET37_9PEZI|nr:hypothetical protein FN846DRAFT_88575 [Sphaerosporella brunnea]